jgi:hypothetical protein
MFGVVFGKTTGVAPGYNLALGYRKIELISQGEYVVDTGDTSNSFFYSWNELVYSPVNWFHAGLVSQRTRAYQTPLDVQRGFSAGLGRFHNLRLQCGLDRPDSCPCANFQVLV